jgi:hypothetical protein
VRKTKQLDLRVGVYQEMIVTSVLEAVCGGLCSAHALIGRAGTGAVGAGGGIEVGTSQLHGAGAAAGPRIPPRAHQAGIDAGRRRGQRRGLVRPRAECICSLRLSHMHSPIVLTPPSTISHTSLQGLHELRLLTGELTWVAFCSIASLCRVSEFGDEEEEDAMRHLLGDGVVPLKRNLSGMKRMFGGMSKAESMPNLTAMVPDDLDDPFDYDDGLDLGLDAFGQSPPVPLATDLMDLDREVSGGLIIPTCPASHTPTHTHTHTYAHKRSRVRTYIVRGMGVLFFSVESRAAGREPGGVLWHDGAQQRGGGGGAGCWCSVCFGGPPSCCQQHTYGVHFAAHGRVPPARGGLLAAERLLVHVPSLGLVTGRQRRIGQRQRRWLTSS